MWSFDGRDVDGEAAAALARLFTIDQETTLPGEPPFTAEEVASDLRHPPHGTLQLRWLADDGTGYAGLDVEERPDNPRLAWVDVIVHPDARRRGLGSRFLAAAVEQAAAFGRDVLVAGPPVGGPGVAFAVASGFRTGLVEHENRLRTADLDRSLLEDWVARSAERAGGYELVAVDGLCPDDLAPGVVAVLDAMNDAPMPDVVEPSVFTVEELRANEASRAAREVGRWLLVARRVADGEAAGLTAFHFNPHRPWQVDQADTGVLPAHRGRGLGRWLKAVNLLRLLDERPEVRTVVTENDSGNRPMLSINEALGFRPARRWQLVDAEAPAVLDRLGRIAARP